MIKSSDLQTLSIRRHSKPFEGIRISEHQKRLCGLPKLLQKEIFKLRERPRINKDVKRFALSSLLNLVCEPFTV